MQSLSCVVDGGCGDTEGKGSDPNRTAWFRCDYVHRYLHIIRMDRNFFVGSHTTKIIKSQSIKV